VMKPLRLQLQHNGQVLGEWTVTAGETVVRVIDPDTGRELGQLASRGLGLSTESKAEEEEPELTLPLEAGTASRERHSSVAFAELWVRSARGWQKQGALRVGQKATYGSAKVRLRQGGELVVSPGPRFFGGAELPSGGSLEISAGDRPLGLPPGTSVFLSDAQGYGFFVKSRLGDWGFREVVERTGQRFDNSGRYEPPVSDWESLIEDTRE
jgi:hypothetical protein